MYGTDTHSIGGRSDRNRGEGGRGRWNIDTEFEAHEAKPAVLMSRLVVKEARWDGRSGIALKIVNASHNVVQTAWI